LNAIDTANADGGGWPGGTTGAGSPPYASMERSDPTAPDNDANWHANNGLTRNGLDADGKPINGTPKVVNSAPAPTPTPTPSPISTPTATSTSTPTPVPSPPLAPLSVVINEVAWAGTAASTADEWIELKNNTGNPINLTGWTLVAADGTPHIALHGTIPAHGYFLLERTDDNTVSDLPADQIYTGALGNTGESLTLRDESLNAIDTANADGGGWPEGTTGAGSPSYASMERLASTAPDTDANWHANNGLTRNGLDAESNPINGTPKAANSVPVPTPTPTSSPTSTLTPIPSPTLAPLSVVINEVAWAGTAASTADEWIELRNNTGNPINLTGWTLVAADGTPNIALHGMLPTHGYFLLERTDDHTVSDIPADQTYTGALGNAGESLTLRDGSLNVIDTANADGGGWPGGTTGAGSPPYSSMERLALTVADSDANWGTNDGLTRNGLDADGDPLNGTPKAANSGTAPAPPLAIVISEVVYDGTIPSTEGDEFVGIYNPLTITVGLEEYKVGDEETKGGGEGMYRFPPGTVITPGTCLVVARNAAQFRARFGFYPDFEMCASGSGYTDTPGVPDMTRYTPWGTGSWALANDGDEVLLLGPSDEIVDAVAFRNGAYLAVDVTGTVSAPEPKSFQRVEDWDSDDMQADFVMDQPDPGRPLLVPEPPIPPPPPASLPGEMHGYFGCLHSHSTYSDGSGPPRYAFAVARANRMHFLALTDHSHQFNRLQWADTLAQAQAATVEGAFVGLRGFEWTSQEQGHSDVFATDTYVSRKDPPYDTLAGFYAWLAAQPEAIAQFNHPFGPPYDTGFDQFAYDAAAAQKMALLEVGNGSGQEYHTFEEAYLRALAIGWRLGATNNGDTQTPDWGLDTPHRTGIVAPALTRNDLLAALRARRTFATEDSNLALALRSGGQWMGSTVSPTATIAFSVDFYDPDGEAITLELFDRSIPVAATSVSGAISHTWPVTVLGAAGHFYFARATQADGDRAYTSPLWTEGTAAPESVALNEVLPEPRYEDWNGDGLADSDDEWIELYNLGERAVDLGWWQLDDVGEGGTLPYIIPFGTVIQPKGFLVLFKRETGVALNNDGDWVRLLHLDGSEADAFHYTYSPGDDRSWSRAVDGIGEWTRFFDVTPGEPNRPLPPEPTPTPFPLFTIAEARRQPSRTTVTVRGQVTVPPPLFGEETLYIQDSTGGIMIYTSKDDYLPLAEGDWVVLRGEAYDYHGEREIRIYRDSDLLLHQGAAEPLKPTVIKTGQVDEDHEGLLVMIAGRVVGYERYAIHLDDGTGPARVYIKRGTDIEKPWVEEGQTFSVVGIVSQYTQEKPYEGGYRLLPRYPSDLLQLPSYLPETGTFR
jgi:hypothetical protein